MTDDAYQALAYEFNCDGALEEIHIRLNRRPHEWMARDSHWYGDYLSSVPGTGLRMRLYERIDGVGPPYTLQCVARSGVAMTRSELTAILEPILATLEARNVTEVEPWD